MLDSCVSKIIFNHFFSECQKTSIEALIHRTMFLACSATVVLSLVTSDLVKSNQAGKCQLSSIFIKTKMD